MADISKINAVALANIAKLDAVTAANIAKVNGLVFSTAPAFVGLLDTYTGAAAGYSTRRLASATTVLLRVRRDTGGGTGDDDEADVAYDSNNILSLDSAISNASAGVTATTLGQFLNVGTVNGTTYTNPDSLTVTASCYVDTWYDQAGSNNVEQSAFGAQPQIHSGTVNTDLITENGQPALQFDSDKLGEVSISLTQPFTSTSVFRLTGTPSFSSIFGSRDGTGVKGGFVARTTNWWMQSSGLADTGQAHDNTQHLFYSVWDGASSEFAQDGGSITTLNPGTVDWTNLAINSRGTDAPASGQNGFWQELILWNTDQTGDGNRSGIEGNQNAHFQIGNFGTPTSGLLFDYPDAAAAYSVRQLANTAALSMRVRRDTAGGTGDDDEADVLFDFTLTDPTISLDSRINNPSAGVASTTLGEFLNATGYTDVDNLTVVADGFCDTWYDQSGNGNDAEQDVPGSQPQIFDSASPTDLITENGKPAVDFDSTADSFVLNLTNSASNYSVHIVNKNNASTSFLFDSELGRLVFDGRGGSRGVYYDGNWEGTSHTGQNQQLQSIYCVSSNSGQSYLNGSQINTGVNYTQTAIGGETRLGSTFDGAAQRINGPVQEFILYASDKSGNRTGIETDINTYFSIY